MYHVSLVLQVYGALKAIDEGAHAEYVLADEDSVSVTRFRLRCFTPGPCVGSQCIMFRCRLLSNPET